jgi:polyferredoxin
MDSINILFAVAWLVGGLMWLRRAMTKEARSNALVSLSPQPETAEKDRRWGMWVNAVLYVMLGLLYLLKSIFSRQH